LNERHRILDYNRERNSILDYHRELTTEYNRLTSEGAIAAQEHQRVDPSQEQKNKIEANRLGLLQQQHGLAHPPGAGALYMQRINSDSFLCPELSI